MTEVIPAILAKDYQDLSAKISRVANLSRVIQIDICDGNFVSSTSWPMGARDELSVEKILAEEEGLPYWDTLDFEFDLMVRNAHQHFDFFTRLGAKRVVFHIDAEDENDFKDFLEAMDPYYRENIEIGLAINIDTPIEKLEKFINYASFVQCMGIKQIGYQGEPFDEKVIEQIKSIKTNYPDMIVSVDGAVDEDTAPVLVEAGADRLIVGSALSRSLDVRETIKYLEGLSR